MLPIYSTWLESEFPADTGEDPSRLSYYPIPFHRSYIVLPEDDYSVNMVKTKDGNRYFALYATGVHTSDRVYRLVVIMPGQNAKPYDPNSGGGGQMGRFISQAGATILTDPDDVIYLGIYGMETVAGSEIGDGTYDYGDLSNAYNPDHEGFLSTLIARIRTKYKIKEVMISAESKGSIITYNLLSGSNHRVRKLSVNSGGMLAGTTIDHGGKLNIQVMHSDIDGTIPIAGGAGGIGTGAEGYMFEAAEDIFDMWATQNGNAVATTLNEYYAFVDCEEMIKDDSTIPNRVIYFRSPNGDHGLGDVGSGGVDDTALPATFVNEYMADFMNSYIPTKW